MKYKIKWFWYGAEQSTIVDSNDDAKPLVVIYEFENNICRVDRFTVLWSNQEWGWRSSDMKPAKIVPIHNYELVRGNWYIDDSQNKAVLYYRDNFILNFCNESYSLKKTVLANWFIEHQPMLQEWQIELLSGSYEALNYLKASIEHG